MNNCARALYAQYQEDSSELKELSKYKPHILLTQENTQIKELQQENRGESAHVLSFFPTIFPLDVSHCNFSILHFLPCHLS